MTVLDAPATSTPAPVPPERPARPAPMWRARVAAVCLALVAVAFLQDPGRVASDTKLDLTVNPWGFLGRALNLWDTEGFFGQLQNQSYGYLWPMGPFFGVGQALGLPDWVVQRLWWSLVLVAAFLGMYLLLRALRVGFGWPQILAALGYALAVRPQSALGAISVEVWPMAVAPWVLLPLVRGARRGRPARAAALSALAVATAGGVNAVAAGAVLPLALWWLLTLQPGPRRRRLLGWWSALTLLAIMWWFIPLILLGRYSPPFLDWIESAEFTTSVTGPTAVLSGSSHWLAYLGQASGWESGWMLATYPLFIAVTGIVAAAGLAGLATRSLPHRAFLVGGAIAGFVLVSAGHTGVLSGLGSEQVQDFLDAAGAPLRNVHKFDLILRIPLLVGFCHLLSMVWPRGPRPRWRVAVTVALIGSLAVSWWPTLSGQVTRGRSYVALAEHWREASFWLNEVAEPGRALIVPGASFGEYVWGRTQDEPLQALGGYPWGVRDAVPLSSAGNIRMLDAVEARLAAGSGGAGLSEYLTRMGVRYLVVRNDLDPGAAAPAPIRVHEALADSPGVRRVAWFGPIVERPIGGPTIIEEGIRESYPAVEIYSVSPSNAAADPRVILRPAGNAVAVEGSPEAMLPLAQAGLLGNRPVALAGDPEATALQPGETVLTDTDRRREITFGYMRDNESATMTGDQPYVQRRAVHDYRVFGPEGETQAVPGLKFDASSSAADVGATWRKPRGADPAAAMDGALDTYWRPGALNEADSFWEVRYEDPVDLPESLTLALLNRGTANPATIPLIITTDNGTTRVDAQDDAWWQTVPVAGGPTRVVRIAVAPRAQALSQFGIREARLPGEGVHALRLPAGTTADAVVLTARPGDVGECVTRDALAICSDGFGQFSQDRTGLHRTVDLATSITSDPRLLVRPRDGSAVARALQAVSEVSVSASSSRTGAVTGSPRAAFDREVNTAWQAAPNDPQPSISIRLPRAETLRGIRLVNRIGLNASSPLEVRVSVGGRTLTGFTDGRGLFRFEPVRTDRITATFLTSNQVRSRSALGEVLLPVGLSEIALIGADEQRQPLPPDAVVTMPCGTGPDLLVDGEVVSQTSVTGRVSEFERGRTMPAATCSAPVTIPAGQHDVTVRSSPAWQPVLAAFAPDAAYSPTGRPTSPEVVTWSDTEREVRIPADDAAQVLEVAENYNPGWRARLGDEDLQPVRLEGWKQGFLVPAGAGGDAVLTFAPDGTYRAGLLGGLVALALVALVAIRPPGRGAADPTRVRALARFTAVAVGVGVLVSLGPWGLLTFGLAWLIGRRVPLPALTFGAVCLAVAVQAVLGINPGSAAQAAQGLAVGLAWGGVALAAMRAAAGTGRASAAEPVAR